MPRRFGQPAVVANWSALLRAHRARSMLALTTLRWRVPRVDRLADMETFVRVIEAGSFSAAAQQMRLGQPAVSKAISRLERRLGVSLVLRSTRGLRPTEAGQSYYEEARAVLQRAEQAELAALTAGKSLSGRLRISAPVTFARLHIVPNLGDLLKAHPALDVEVVLSDREVDMIEEGIDVALRLGSLVDSTLTALKPASRRRLVLAAPRYFQQFGKPLRPQELAQHEAVIYTERQGGLSWTFHNGAEEVAVTLKGRVRVSGAEGVREAVFAGLGLTISSEWMFTPELASGVVETALTDWGLPEMDLWAVFPAGRLASSASGSASRGRNSKASAFPPKSGGSAPTNPSISSAARLQARPSPSRANSSISRMCG
jgi:DNA-binding transcriptional LysR family regulator